jgi:Domain of unknown function (DUF5655)
VLVEREGPKEQKERCEWLKTKHKFGTNNAARHALRTDGKGSEEDSPEAYLKAAVGYVEEQYPGPKMKLRSMDEKLLAPEKSLGPDVTVCPGMTMVSPYRKHVFAQIKPSTNTRIDLGFALASFKGKISKRLIDTGGLAKKDRITHRMEIKSAADVDDDVRKWLKVAHDLDI